MKKNHNVLFNLLIILGFVLAFFCYKYEKNNKNILYGFLDNKTFFCPKCHKYQQQFKIVEPYTMLVYVPMSNNKIEVYCKKCNTLLETYDKKELLHKLKD